MNNQPASSKEFRKEKIDKILSVMQSGESCKTASFYNGISSATCGRWVKSYRLFGMDGLVDRRHGNTGRPRKAGVA
jgi:transposase